MKKLSESKKFLERRRNESLWSYRLRIFKQSYRDRPRELQVCDMCGKHLRIEDTYWNNRYGNDVRKSPLCPHCHELYLQRYWTDNRKYLGHYDPVVDIIFYAEFAYHGFLYSDDYRGDEVCYRRNSYTQAGARVVGPEVLYYDER